MAGKPAYRKKSGRQQAVVTLSDADTGKRKEYPLGPYGSDESWSRYWYLIEQWRAAGERWPDEPDAGRQRIGQGPSVSRVVVEYVKHAKGYYSKGKQPDIIAGVNAMRGLYGSSPASEIGPKALRDVRGAMLEKGLARKTINGRIDHIRRMFKWAASHELVPAGVHEALRTVPGLRKGEYGVNEGRDVQPVPEAHINAIKPYVSDQVWALIQLQLLTGARGGELLIMRPMDLDRSGKIWLYEPESHKGQHRGHSRTIYIGPQAQTIIKPYLDRSPHAYLFSPREARQAWEQRRREQRKTPEGYGNRSGSNKKTQPTTQPGECYSPSSYRTAIRRACEKACVPHWHPHRLRHNAGTYLRHEFGVEAARLILGHSDANITAEVYAEADREKAKQIVGEVG
jgi:integrase